MFSWIDYFDQNVMNKDIKEEIKILEKSNSCKLMSKSTFSNTTRSKIRDYKSKSNTKQLSDDHCNKLRNKSSCKILDLSPEEKEKLAKLIKELGQLQSEKEQISHKFNDERNEFLLKIQSIEEMHNLTIKEKQKLEDVLRIKEEMLVKLETQIRFDRPTSVDISNEFVLIPRDSLKTVTHKRESSKPKDSAFLAFPGPPSSSRSKEIKHELMRTHSSASSSHARQHLTDEHERLMIEKQYLDVVLKQQKCLDHLKNKIKKLERMSSREKVRTPVESKIEDDTSSVLTISGECLIPKVLNELSDDNSTLSRSVSILSRHNLRNECIKLDGLSQKIERNIPPLKSISAEPDSMIFRDEDLFIISALNEDPMKTGGQNHILSPSKYHTSRASIRTHSPTDSLFDIISNLDDIDSDKCDISSLGSLSIKQMSEEDILCDLFFNQ